MPPALPSPLPMPPNMMPHPAQFPVMPVQRYSTPPFHGNAPQPPPPHQQPTYNTYNPDTRNFQSHERNGRDQNKRGDGNWNYRKGGHGERHYRDWVEMDRRNYGADRGERPPRDRPWPRVCAYFNTKQGCREGDNCRFLHEKGHHGSIPSTGRRDDRDGADWKKSGSEDVKESKMIKEKTEKKTESQENKSPIPIT